jgi:hypothetical protein
MPGRTVGCSPGDQNYPLSVMLGTVKFTSPRSQSGGFPEHAASTAAKAGNRIDWRIREEDRSGASIIHRIPVSSSARH